MIKNIIFDIGGVLGPNSNEWGTTFSKILDMTSLTEDEVELIFKKHWPKAIVGEEGMENFWTEVYKSSKNHQEPGELEKAYQDSMTIDQDVVEAVKKLKEKGYKLALITNMSSEWLQMRVKKFKLTEYFEHIYCSCKIGVAKPDQRVFEHIINEMEIEPEETVFVDNLKENTDVAARMGFKSMLFQNADQLRLDLTSYGVNFD